MRMKNKFLLNMFIINSSFLTYLIVVHLLPLLTLFFSTPNIHTATQNSQDCPTTL